MRALLLGTAFMALANPAGNIHSSARLAAESMRDLADVRLFMAAKPSSRPRRAPSGVRPPTVKQKRAARSRRQQRAHRRNARRLA